MKAAVGIVVETDSRRRSRVRWGPVAKLADAPY